MPGLLDSGDPSPIDDRLSDDDSDEESQHEENDLPKTLPFPPITRAHILHCSYHYWHPRYRAITPKARLVPLTAPFISYLRADGILLPSNEPPPPPRIRRAEWSDTDSGIYSASDAQTSDGEDEDEVDVAAEWRDVHEHIRATVRELGGSVVPKLNWSAPKDATWMNSNALSCRAPDEIYLLLKSSDFVTHDLGHAFDGCEASSSAEELEEAIPYVLALRKTVDKWNPALEFRCFVRRRRLLGISQRDLNHFPFLFPLQDKLRQMIQEFFDVRLRDTFPDESFAFDVYVPTPYNRVWLVDINPWAPRTDPLLWSWLELLTMPEPPEMVPSQKKEEGEGEEEFVRLSIVDPASTSIPALHLSPGDEVKTEQEEEEADEEIFLPELRLIRKSDPEAYSFSTPQYSAHKLPKDVVDAASGLGADAGDGAAGGLREFARDWEDLLARRRQQEAEESDSDDD